MIDLLEGLDLEEKEILEEQEIVEEGNKDQEIIIQPKAFIAPPD